jgi:hypothetical protein
MRFTEMTARYEIVTLNPSMDGEAEADTIGVNEPRSFAECTKDIAAFRNGACGLDFVHGDYGIRDTESGEVRWTRDPNPGPDEGGD